MADEATLPIDVPGAPFEFLSPLDGQTYTLPPFDKTLLVDVVAEHLEELPPIPTIFEALTGGNPSAMEEALDKQSKWLGWTQTMTLVSTLDKHLPEDDNPAKAAIVAIVNAADFAFLYKLYMEWVAASGGVVESPEGEG